MAFQPETRAKGESPRTERQLTALCRRKLEWVCAGTTRHRVALTNGGLIDNRLRLEAQRQISSGRVNR